MRTLVIGDIHGGLKALKQVLALAEIQATDRLIFVGDYVDGWSESAQVIAFLIDLATKQECVFLKGNHDEWCLNWLKYNRTDVAWLKHGGKETLISYEKIPKAEHKQHIEFFERLLPFYVSNENKLFVHAGFSSTRGPYEEPDQSVFYWDRNFWEMAYQYEEINKRVPNSEDSRFALFLEIYIGHTPTVRYGSETPIKVLNVWNVDTGAAFTGKLSIMDIETKQIWQSDYLQKLYPDEKGRN